MPAFYAIDTLDPWHNLAVERFLFETFTESPHPDGGMDSDPDHALLVWRNSPCVVIGRHQNPWIECDLARMAAEAVPLVRRVSGGGAVYHDTGNTNFTFFGIDSTYDLDRQFSVVISALESLGISAGRNTRNDLLVGYRKVSGNAFRHTKGRSLHHGTLLVSADLDKLTAFLTSPAAASPEGKSSTVIISSKGIPSVRSRVINLSEIRVDVTHRTLAEALRTAYREEYGPAQSHGSTSSAWPGDDGREQIALYERELKSWEWRFGKSPTFSHRVIVQASGQTAAAELTVTVRHGRIEKVAASSDTVQDVAGTANAADEILRGVRFVREEIVARGGAVMTAIGDAAGPEMPGPSGRSVVQG